MRSLLIEVAGRGENLTGAELTDFMRFARSFDGDFDWNEEVESSCADLLFHGVRGYLERGETPPGEL